MTLPRLHHVLAVLLALALLALGAQTYRLVAEQRDHAVTVADHSDRVAAMERGAREAIEAARTEEKRRTADVQKVADETQQALEQARADADAAADAGRRLRAQLAAVASACSRGAGNPSAASAGPPAQATSDLLADVQRRLDEATDRIARFADQAHAAGYACERASDAVRSPPALSR